MSTGYITLEEANTYVSSNYLSTDTLRTGWEALSDSDKTSALSRAYQEIDMLPFQGRKYDLTQVSAFPRFPYTTVPDSVKNAQVEHALSLVASAASSEENIYEKMWTFGVQSYSIGNLSESLGQVTSGGSLALEHGITSVKAQRLLKPFLNGGFRI